nr:hypothetical protein [Tanacetum cinerariifolium]
MPQRVGEYIASAPCTPLVKPGGGIRPIDVGGCEAILHAVNRLIEDRGDDVGLSIFLVDFKNAFNLVDREALELIMDDGPSCGLHLNVDKTKVFWPKEDSRSRLAGIFPLNIARPLHGVKLLGGPASVDFDFNSELVMKRVTKTIVLMGDVLNYAFLASRLQSASLQTKLLRHCGIVASGSIFHDALCAFNTKMKTDILSNPTCSRVFTGDIYGDYVVSCTGIIGIKHRHNIVRDTLVDICYRFGISAGKEVDIGLDGGRDKPLRLADMLLYSWDGGLDVCVDLTGSSSLTQTGMVDFVPGRAVIDVVQCKRAMVSGCRLYNDSVAVVLMLGGGGGCVIHFR